MVTLLLHLLRLLPFFCGGHRQLAIENLALRQQLAVYTRTATRPRLRTTDRLFWVGLARAWTRWETPPRDRDSRHRPEIAALPLPRVLDPALRPAERGPPPRPLDCTADRGRFPGRLRAALSPARP